MKNHTHATILTLHLFNQAIWGDVWKSFNGDILLICNYCDSASIQAGDLRRHVKTNIWENRRHATNMTLHVFNHSRTQFEKTFENHLMKKFRTSATLVSLNLFKQVIWEDTWKLTFEKITHMQLMWLCIWSSRQFEKTFENHLIEKFCTSAAIVPLHLFKQAI